MIEARGRGIVKVFVEDGPTPKAQLKQAFCVTQETGWLWVVRSILTLVKGNGVHAAFLCCCAQGFKLPDTGWRSMAGSAQVFGVLT